ncbi:MAG TPA: PAC2 family protein [Ilumatobacter sp.]|nr:PAC2 family protein [Ilumatobacter sp.]
MDESLRMIGDMPTLVEPTLIVVLGGWIDAGAAAALAVGAINSESETTAFAEFDDDVYIDYRARRPTMELRDGLHTVLNWERILLSSGSDQTGRDLVVLSGPEPDMAWHRFSRAVGDLATTLGVTQMAHLGAYPFAVPHTRPTRLSVSSPSEDVLKRVTFLRSSLDVPAGIAASLERELHDRGIPSLGIWAQVPHYSASGSFPPASTALLDGLREATGLVIDAPGLRSFAIEHSQRLDEMIAGNEDHTRMIGQLEELYDSTDDSVEVIGGGGPSLEMLSGDELAAELEQFLRDQD